MHEWTSTHVEWWCSTQGFTPALLAALHSLHADGDLFTVVSAHDLHRLRLGPEVQAVGGSAAAPFAEDVARFVELRDALLGGASYFVDFWDFRELNRHRTTVLLPSIVLFPRRATPAAPYLDYA